MPSNHLILCHPLLLLPLLFPSIRVFSNESVLHIKWPKYWSFSFSISPSSEYSGLIYFRIDWLDLLAVQGILKSLLQYHSSKASILLHSAFFIAQLSHPYMTTGKAIPWTTWIFVGKVMSPLFNMLSRLVITFLPRSKCLLISRLQSPSAVSPNWSLPAGVAYPQRILHVAVRMSLFKCYSDQQIPTALTMRSAFFSMAHKDYLIVALVTSSSSSISFSSSKAPLFIVYTLCFFWDTLHISCSTLLLVH